MILTPDFVKHSIDQYNSKMERERQEKMVAKIIEASNYIARVGRQGQGDHLMIGQDYLDEMIKGKTINELFGDENFKVYREPIKEPINRIISDIDPYGEENWEK